MYIFVLIQVVVAANVFEAQRAQWEPTYSINQYQAIMFVFHMLRSGISLHATNLFPSSHERLS